MFLSSLNWEGLDGHVLVSPAPVVRSHAAGVILISALIAQQHNQEYNNQNHDEILIEEALLKSKINI
jgi:hypothetical protein